jgi:hypothetical protein
MTHDDISDDEDSSDLERATNQEILIQDSPGKIRKNRCKEHPNKRIEAFCENC